MFSCCNCNKNFNILIYLPLYGYLCKECFQEIRKDYLK